MKKILFIALMMLTVGIVALADPNVTQPVGSSYGTYTTQVDADGDGQNHQTEILHVGAGDNQADGDDARLTSNAHEGKNFTKNPNDAPEVDNDGDETGRVVRQYYCMTHTDSTSGEPTQPNPRVDWHTNYFFVYEYDWQECEMTLVTIHKKITAIEYDADGNEIGRTTYVDNVDNAPVSYSSPPTP